MYYNKNTVIYHNGSFRKPAPFTNFYAQTLPYGNGVRYAPPKGHILPGVTSATIMDICAEQGIKVKEKRFTTEELKQTDSAFFTGTAAEVVGRESLDEYRFPFDWKKSWGTRFLDLYQFEVMHLRTLKTDSCEN